MRVYISSGSHITRVEKRVDVINQHLDSPEIVFAEGAESDTRKILKRTGRPLPIAPLITVAAFVHIFIYIRFFARIMAIVTCGKIGPDKDVMRTVADHPETTIQEIDTFYSAMPVHEHPKWGIINWGALILVSTMAWWFFDTLFGVILAVVIVLIIGFVLLKLMLNEINENREDRMVTEILSEADTVESACIVIGEDHHPGVGKRLQSYNDIDVINPTQTSTD